MIGTVIPRATIMKGYCPPEPYFSLPLDDTVTNPCAARRRRNIHTRRSLHRTAGLDAHRRIAVGGERRQDVAGVRGVARFDRDVELGALGRHVEEQPAVIDSQDI